MKPLEPPDSMHVSASLGWLGLGNWQEANEELKKVAPALHEHPEVLAARWEICAKTQNWDAAADLAVTLTKLNPESSWPVIVLAYATRRKKEGGIEKARAILEAAQEQFPKEATIAYNLACYECQLGDLGKARLWLKKAYDLGGPNVIKPMALGDKDLEPLWAEIKDT